MSATEYLNVTQAAEQLGVHRNTIANWETRGMLRAARLPGSGFRRFAKADVERMRREMYQHMAPMTELPEQQDVISPMLHADYS